MAWLILGHRLILNQSQPLTGHSPFHIEIERNWIPFTDWDLEYCTVCNCINPSHPFNPMTPYFDTSPGHAGNPCVHSRFLSASHFWISLELFLLPHFWRALSITLPNAPLSQPRLRLHHSLACSPPLPLPHRHCFPHTQFRHISKNKEKMAAHIPTPKHLH